MGQALYRQEPVARAVLDQCDALVRNQRGESLLEVMFGAAGNLDEPGWSALAVWALQCALVAQWESVGVRPSVVVGDGLGEIAGGQAAGVFGLDEGLLLVAARDMESAPVNVQTGPPKLDLVSGETGRRVEAGEVQDGAYWQRQSRATPALERSVATLANLGVEVVAEIGPQPVLAPNLPDIWPKGSAPATAPTVLISQAKDSSGIARDGAFVAAVAGAYEAGLSISFPGLFAGEARSRISLPGYPFQHRRHWINAPRGTSSVSGQPQPVELRDQIVAAIPTRP
ncbi:MAG: acyltransferase domain-containing protein [Gammaproteobacteria bacterium]|nr:acyltransferase domain-containing protein [Gammaproteobacteria bacterium]